MDSKNADHFAKPIEDLANLIVPSIVMYEVYKKLVISNKKPLAIDALAYMQESKVIGIHTNAALTAATLSMEHKLHMADAMILAIAKQAGATIWTQDKDFKDIEGVKFFAA